MASSLFLFILLGLLTYPCLVNGDALPQIDFQVNIRGFFNETATTCPECSVCDHTLTTPGYNSKASDWASGVTPCPGDPSGCCTVKYVAPTGPICSASSGFGPFNDEAQKVWGACGSNDPKPCYCLTGSGIGVEGFKNLTMISNPNGNVSTAIARVTHYNNGIAGMYTNLPRVMQLTFNLSSSQFPNGNSFVVSYLLYFYETPNDNDTVVCDYSIQTSDQPCDDIFWFGTTSTSATFTLGNAKYTLVVDGFKRNETSAPVPRFLTPEYNVNTAFIYARLVTVCAEVTCPTSSVFLGFPTCACSCTLTETQCQQLFGTNWALDNTTCSCYCAANTTSEEQAICQSEFPSANASSLVWNEDRCGCDCNLTNAYCAKLNPLFEVAPAPAPCACRCSASLYQDCLSLHGRYWQPDATNSCACVCAVSDSICAQDFGSGYTASFTDCGCVGPSSGLTTGQIVGIAIGSAAGALLLILLVASLFALLLFLIFKGVIPGIYGVKFEPAPLNAAQESPFYRDRWTVSTANTLAD